MPAATTHTSLAINLDQWRGEVGRYFGFGRTYSSMTASQQADVDAVIDRGLRQFYAPPLMKDGSVHIWSFMRPTMNIVVHAPYSTGTITTISGSGGNALVFFSVAASVPTWSPGASLIFTHPTSELERIIKIYSRISAGHLTLADVVPADDLSSGTVSYVITDGIQTLPTSFGGIEGDITLSSGSGYMPVRQVGEDQIREMFLNGAIQTGVPAFFCVRPWRDPQFDRGTSAPVGASYTRYEMVFFPRPDATYNMSFRYLYVFPGVADIDALTPANTDLVMPGLAYHHEAILASCLAVAEEYADSPNGKYREYFQERLLASASLDRKVAGDQYFGQNIDRSDSLRGRIPIRTNVTYENTQY
jgi:hypothetical protein